MTQVTEAARDGPDPRLTKAIIRTIIFPTEGPRLAYYLPESDDVAEVYSRKRRSTDVDVGDVVDHEEVCRFSRCLCPPNGVLIQAE